MHPAPTIDATGAGAGLLLALDTSGPVCAAALAGTDGSRIVGSRTEPMERGHAERLLPLIGEILREAGAGYGDLARVGVTIGPGSFTGVRVGIAAARGLALALAIPAVGVGTLDALLPDAGTEVDAEGTAVAALDARRGEIYVLAGAGGEIRLPASALLPEAAARILLDRAAQPFRLAGSGSAFLAEALRAVGAGAVTIASSAPSPAIEKVARLAALSAMERPPVPLYLRAPDAKVQAGGVALAEGGA